MSKPVIVFVHGRAQGGKDAAALCAIWLDTLRAGLGQARAGVLDGVEVRFPYYGDRLDQVTAAASAPADVAHRGDGAADDPAYADFLLEFVDNARRSRGITDEQILDHVPAAIQERGPLQWEWIHAILRTLEHVPGLSGDMIERFTRDVWVYLTEDNARAAINEIVSAAIRPDEQTIVVAHSLGTVVAFDVIRNTPRLQVPLYLTVGSPLAQRPIRSHFTPLKRPSSIRDWFNAFDERDVVALYPLDAANFNVAPPVHNYDRIRNGTDNAHGITGYLNDATVAGQIYKSLRALGS